MSNNGQDYQDSESEGSGFVTGLFIGAILGAAAALLYAPASGEATRQQLKDLADQNKQNLKGQWDKTKDKASALVDTVQGKIDAVAEKASHSVDVYADKAVEKVIAVSEDAKHTVDKFRRNHQEPGEV